MFPLNLIKLLIIITIFSFTPSAHASQTYHYFDRISSVHSAATGCSDVVPYSSIPAFDTNALVDIALSCGTRTSSITASHSNGFYKVKWGVNTYFSAYYSLVTCEDGYVPNESKACVEAVSEECESQPLGTGTPIYYINSGTDVCTGPGTGCRVIDVVPVLTENGATIIDNGGVTDGACSFSPDQYSDYWSDSVGGDNPVYDSVRPPSTPNGIGTGDCADFDSCFADAQQYCAFDGKELTHFEYVSADNPADAVFDIECTYTDVQCTSGQVWVGGSFKTCMSDKDGDSIADVDDAFPNDPLEYIDTDGDGIGDNSDSNPDNADDGGYSYEPTNTDTDTAIVSALEDTNREATQTNQILTSIDTEISGQTTLLSQNKDANEQSLGELEQQTGLLAEIANSVGTESQDLTADGMFKPMVDAFNSDIESLGGYDPSKDDFFDDFVSAVVPQLVLNQGQCDDPQINVGNTTWSLPFCRHAGTIRYFLEWCLVLLMLYYLWNTFHNTLRRATL